MEKNPTKVSTLMKPSLTEPLFKEVLSVVKNLNKLIVY